MIDELLTGDLWLLLLIQGTACLAGGMVASFALRHRPARAHQVLLTALLASVLMPGLYLSTRHFGLGLLTPKMAGPAQDVRGGQPLDASLLTHAIAGEVAYEPGVLVTEAAAPPVATAHGLWEVIAVAGWIGVAATLLLRLALRFLLGWRVVHTACPMEDERLCQAVEAARNKLGMRGMVQVRSSARVRSPIIWCWGPQPILLVHQSASGADRVDWVGVFCHELSHWKRFDHLSGLWAEVLTAVLPWHPLLWSAKGRLLRLSEQICDDWVLASGPTALDYAESLLNLAPGGQAALIPTIIGKEKTMRERIRRIVKDGGGNPQVGIRWALAVSALAALASVAVAFAQQPPAAAEQREDAPQPELRQERAAPSPAITGRRNVLIRLREQLQQQLRDTETALRQHGDNASEEGHVLDAERDALHEQIQLTEQQLRDLERGPQPAEPTPARDLGPRPTQWEARSEDLKQRHNELAEQSHQIEQALQGLPPDQDQKARELQARLQVLREQTGAIDRQLVDLQQPRAEPGRPEARLRGTERPATPQRIRRVPTGTEGRIRAETRVYALEHIRPEKMQALVEALIDKPESVTLYAEGRKAAICATAENQQRIERIIRIVDVPEDEYTAGVRQDGTFERMQAITLRHFSPKRMHSLLAAVLDQTGRVSLDERTRTLIVSTTLANMGRVESIVRALDVPADDRVFETEVEELRNQMRGLNEQMQQMQRRLDQIAERDRGPTMP